MPSLLCRNSIDCLQMYHLSFSAFLSDVAPARALLHTCQMCNDKFTSEEDLDLHKVTHKVTHPHECTICNVMFTDEGYKEHNDNLASRHPVSCPLCPERFKNRKQLRGHITIHEIREFLSYGYRQVLPCNLCERKFRFLTALLEHQAWHQRRTHHKKVKHEDIPSCSMCCRKFETKEERDWHEAFEHSDDCKLIEGDDNDEDAYGCTGK